MASHHVAKTKCNEGSMFSRSTIYKRHETRLHRNSALKDDPRPTPVRILSQLPGFRSFFLPYNPRIHGRRSDPQQVLTRPQHSAKNGADNNSMVTTAASGVLPTILSVALSSGAAYYIIGLPRSTLTPPIRSPFLSNTTAVARTAIATSSSVMATTATSTQDLLYLHNHRPMGTAAHWALPTRTAASSGMAFFTSITTLRLTVYEIIKHQQETGESSTASTVLASGIAGITTTIATNLLSGNPTISANGGGTSAAQRFFYSISPTMPPGTVRTTLLGQVVASALYCGLWDVVQQTNSSDPSQRTLLQLPTTLAAGGLAGCMVHGTWRAAPLHALVFVGASWCANKDEEAHRCS